MLRELERPQGPAGGGRRIDLRALIGSGDRITLFTLPFLIVGVVLNVAFPSLFDVGGPPAALATISIALSVAGIAIWLWSVALLLTRARRGELITTGPFRLVKHPIYTSVALLVLPWTGFLLDTWLGALLGVVMYVGARMFAPAEDAELSKRFGSEWTRYRDTIAVPWL
jgi:protein-S-isoprenylcysteine O-methyltransferase Ste14